MPTRKSALLLNKAGSSAGTLSRGCCQLPLCNGYRPCFKTWGRIRYFEGLSILRAGGRRACNRRGCKVLAKPPARDFEALRVCPAPFWERLKAAVLLLCCSSGKLLCCCCAAALKAAVLQLISSWWAAVLQLISSWWAAVLQLISSSSAAGPAAHKQLVGCWQVRAP